MSLFLNTDQGARGGGAEEEEDEDEVSEAAKKLNIINLGMV